MWEAICGVCCFLNHQKSLRHRLYIPKMAWDRFVVNLRLKPGILRVCLKMVPFCLLKFIVAVASWRLLPCSPSFFC